MHSAGSLTSPSGEAGQHAADVPLSSWLCAFGTRSMAATYLAVLHKSTATSNMSVVQLQGKAHAPCNRAIIAYLAEKPDSGNPKLGVLP